MVWWARSSAKDWCPAFQAKDNYSQGVYDTVQAYVATLAAKRGFSVEGIDQRNAYRGAPTSEPDSPTRGGLISACCIGTNYSRSS